MPTPIVGMIGASVVGGVAQASAAKKAAAAQTAAAEKDIAFQRETRDLIFDRLDPFYQPGIVAQQALAYEMGLGAAPTIGGAAPEVTEVRGGSGLFGNATGPLADVFRSRTGSTTYRVGDKTFKTRAEAEAYANANPTGGTAYRGFTADPGYQFRLSQGQDAVNALAGAKGGLFSGATLQALADYNQGLASQEYGNYFARLSGLAGQGLGAASGQATAATNAASGVSNALAGVGNAQSAGAIGVGNAISGAINNGIGIWGYQQGLRPSGGGTGSFGLPRPF